MAAKFGGVPLLTFEMLLLMLPGILHLAHSSAITRYPNGLGDLLANVNYLNQNLQSDIARMQQQIQQNVQDQIQQAHETVTKAIENAKAGGTLIQLGPGITVTNGNNVVMVNSADGSAIVPAGIVSQSLVMQSGLDPISGKPYTLETKEFVEKGILTHTERLTNQTSGTIEESGYIRDLNQPSAEPVYLPTNVTQIGSVSEE
ncbi:hypothetical protein QAD02_017700 [Eretmocerus hayati]|uniref:Uncharacterized protein n=1 Tax=Eretmocerus hayati TaxID=131215 RepID=A0ACC2PEK2_9HYME|nr:hypothetical protein QAD02_017700 [Eretmocerus hayati]